MYKIKSKAKPIPETFKLQFKQHSVYFVISFTQLQKKSKTKTEEKKIFQSLDAAITRLLQPPPLRLRILPVRIGSPLLFLSGPLLLFFEFSQLLLLVLEKGV